MRLPKLKTKTKKGCGEKDSWVAPANSKRMIAGSVHRIVLVLFCLAVTALYSQTTDESDSQEPVFRSKVGIVVVDVTVTDENDKPVTGLNKEDFEVSEAGNPQTISSFEEHRSVAPSDENQNKATQNPVAPLLPDVFTNHPAATFTDSVNVLFFDALNTSWSDQSNVYVQMMDYIKHLHPGPRFAIFSLGSQLRMVQGFTADPSVLLAALNHKQWGGSPQYSPMLPTEAEDAMNAHVIQGRAAGLKNPEDAAQMQRVQSEMQQIQTDTCSLTLEAFRQLAHFLATFPGRKNVIWFSGSFPISIRSGACAFRDENILAAAQVAIYPINAAGIQTDSYTNASTITVPSRGADFAKALQQEGAERNAKLATMGEIADDTGGKAWNHTNGFKEALAEAVNSGANYYTISYSPADKRADGSYRRITVKLNTGGYKLSYRRGYYADGTNEIKNGQAQSSGNLLQSAMAHGIPEAAQLRYTVRIAPESHPSPAVELAGDNENFNEAATRYSVDFNLDAKDLDLAAASDGNRKGDLEISLVAYDHAGNALNWLARHIELTYSADRYLAVQKTGIPVHLEIDAPQGDMYLRTGVYDTDTQRVGTLEVPLQQVVPISTPASAVEMVSVAPSLKKSAVLQPSLPPAIPLGSNSEESLSIQSSGDVEESVGSIPVQPVVPPDVAAYCSAIDKSDEHNEALAGVCKFALSLRKQMPNIICDRQMSRWWISQSNSGTVSNHDQVTSKVAYRDGQEYYEDLRIDGKPANLDDKKSAGTTWSLGEFATDLENIFSPRSNASFRFEKEETLGATSALIFSYVVKQHDNKTYYLHTTGTTGENWKWYPGYSGQMWLDAETFQLLKLERVTSPMLNKPIDHVKTEIDYENIPLGDGSYFVLPVTSAVRTCFANQQNGCADNNIRFNNWHKFRANTQILMDATQ